jgi:ankyrin repeat protein
VLRLLLGAGAHPDPRDHERRTPLIYASIQGHKDVVAALLTAGAAAAAADRFDKRALSLSLEHSNRQALSPVSLPCSHVGVRRTRF